MSPWLWVILFAVLAVEFYIGYRCGRAKRDVSLRVTLELRDLRGMTLIRRTIQARQKAQLCEPMGWPGMSDGAIGYLPPEDLKMEVVAEIINDA